MKTVIIDYGSGNLRSAAKALERAAAALGADAPETVTIIGSPAPLSSPMTAFLVMRGIKTLELRMERHSNSAAAIADMLAAHPVVAWVAYPFHDGFDQVAVARKQMTMGGGLVSFELEGGYEAGMAFMNGVELVTRAVSLGDTETLVQHPASMTHAAYTPPERASHGISKGLAHLSVGLENLEDLLTDMEAGLDAATASRAAAR